MDTVKSIKPNKDFRPDCRQLVFGLNITDDGHVPLTFNLFDGNQADDTTHIPNWEELRQMPGRVDFIYIADCKLCSEDNLDHIHINGGFFITVVPKNRSILKPFQQQLENGEVDWQLAIASPTIASRLNSTASIHLRSAPQKKAIGSSGS